MLVKFRGCSVASYAGRQTRGTRVCLVAGVPSRWCVWSLVCLVTGVSGLLNSSPVHVWRAATS